MTKELLLKRSTPKPSRPSARKVRKSRAPAARAVEQSEFPVVGVGASAGGLESFTQLLSQIPTQSGLAIIFVQHLDPTHPSLATEIFARATQMPVTEVRDGEQVKPNHVYTLPPNHSLTIQKGILRLQPRASSYAALKTIDAFFQSLAADQGTLAIGVVLSGTATDGTQGLRAIKAEGGITLAQTPESAKYDGMPKSAIQAGVVDLILPPDGIAQELLRIAKHPHVSRTPQAQTKEPEPGAEETPKALEEPLSEIISILRRKANPDFSDYRKTTLIRRITRRMVILNLPTERQYADYLKSHPDEVKVLGSEILIHVTNFFRDPEAFAALKRNIFPQIMKDHKKGVPIRIWVPGCSSGEEAYSLAISLLDYLGEGASDFPIQVFASDISETAIQKARQGIYSEANVQELPASILQRYFTKSADTYKVNKSVRDLCLFSKHNVISDPPFARVDLVSCRNLLIYFTPALQKRAIPLLHYALNPNGFLFLGQSETIGSFTDLFRTADKDHKIYQKKLVSGLPKIQFSPSGYTPERFGISRAHPPTWPNAFDTQKEADRIVALKYGPSGVVVNDDLEILHFRGRTFPFLESPAGLASHRLLKMVHPDLASDLRTILQTLKSQSVAVRRQGLRIKHDGQMEELSIEAIPLNPAADPKERQNLILFERSKELRPVHRLAEKKTTVLDVNLAEQRIQQLEQQLEAGKQYQQALGEDHESAQEELTAANEELQSANEELQSTNEEIETAKEELQSTNEELTTVNDELQNRNTEMGQLNNDLINLLGSIEIPIVIVGGDHRIRRFTPAASELLNLIATDVGRPIHDIRTNLNFSDLNSLVTEVMETLKVKEIEVQDKNSHWYRLQARPYRTLDNRIDGAVLAFVDIEGLKTAIGRLKSALDYATSIADALQVPSVVMDRSLRVRSVNSLFCKIFGISAATAEGRLLTELGRKDWDISELKARLEDTILRRQAFQNFEISRDFPGLGRRTFLLSARQIQWTDLPEPESILLSLMDITERKQIETALAESEEKYHALLESAHDAIVATDKDGIIQVINAQAAKWFGYDRTELIGKPIETLVPHAHRESHIQQRGNYTSKPTARQMGERTDLLGLRKDGSKFPIEASLSPVATSRGLLVISVIRDATSRRQHQEEHDKMLILEKELRGEAEKANRAKDVFLATLSHELRTPLSSILTWAQLIRMGKVDFEKAKEGAAVIEQSAKAQSQLIDDLLDISRIIAGKLSLEIKEVDPRAVITVAVESVRPLAEKKIPPHRDDLRFGIRSDSRRSRSPPADHLEPSHQRDQIFSQRRKNRSSTGTNGRPGATFYANPRD